MNGIGVAEHHHGEILQGAVRRGVEVVRCLITMATRRVGSRAKFVPGAVAVLAEAGWDGERGRALSAVAGGGADPARAVAERASGVGLADVGAGRGGAWATRGQVLEVVPAWKLKAARAARLALEFVGTPAEGGRLEIECSVATGVGLGSSTCDVVAAIRAVCAAYGVAVEPDVVARIAVAAEGAVDPIMLDREVVLFAQREGRVLETFGSWIPPYVVVSIDTDAGTDGIDTLSLPPPQYTDAELEAFEGLVARARAGFERRDAAAIAAVATESAAINQRFVPMRGFRELVALAGEVGALGVQIAHSGTVAGILFDAGENSGLLAEVKARVVALGLRPLSVIDAIGHGP